MICLKRCIVVFDFDGVIADSINETYRRSLIAYSAACNELKDSVRLKKQFRKARHFVKIASDYGVVFFMLKKNDKLDFDTVSQESFEFAKKGFRKAAKFEEEYYREANRLLAEDPELFYSLQKPYPGIKEAICNIGKHFFVAVSTTRDKDSTAMFLKKYCIKIPSGNIFSKEISRDKAKHIKKMSADFGVTVSEILLVDDFPEHLDKALSTGARAIFAGWGYNTPVQRKNAKEQGIFAATPHSLPKAIVLAFE